MLRTPRNTATLRLDEARLHLQRGKMKKARACFKQALKLDDRNPEVLAEFGALEAMSGNIGSARTHMQRAIRLAPRNANYHFNLAELERQQKRYGEAEVSFRNALACAPSDPDAMFGLGVCRLMLHAPSEAIEWLTAAHRLSPSDPEILPVLAKALDRAGRLDEAAAVLRQVVARDPENGRAWLDLAGALGALRQFAGADEAYCKSDAIRPIPVATKWKWAIAQIQCGRYQSAIQLLADAIGERPDICESHYARAIAYQVLGDFDRAERDLRRAVEINPDYAEAYERLMLMDRLATIDVDRLESILWGNHSGSDASRTAAGFTLYRHFDKQDNVTQAFRSLAEANRIQKTHCSFTVAEHEIFAQKLKAVFTKEFFRERVDQGCSSEVPIFILGMPRSGSTLVEQILGTFPEVGLGGETLIVPRMTSRLTDFPDCLAEFPPKWAIEAGQSIVDDLTMRTGENRWSTDKTPANYFNIGLISWLLPKAKIIYCDRDPKDIGFSCFEQNFGYSLDFACDFDAFVKAYDIHLDVMEHWSRTVPSTIFHLKYEDLVKSPREVARTLTDFCGLAWNDACVDPSNFCHPVQTASFWQVRQPITPRSLGRWRRYAQLLGDFPDRLDEVRRGRSWQPAP